MRVSAFVLTILPAFALAKDCAIYYDWSGDSQEDVFRDLRAGNICLDMDGEVAGTEIGIQNGGNQANRCTVCRKVGKSTKDSDQTVSPGDSQITYSVRCGVFGKDKCSA
ncbi:hypothetical protein F66182_3324 [Fusarium sp. NRRL 66182]|nr:hypothetical protein F66182_3324 [Fusarium sp. NRRL 66182]